MSDVGLREVVLEALSELLDDELRQKVCLDQLDRETHSLAKLKEWFRHIVLRFINYLATPLNQIQKSKTRIYMWNDKMEKQLSISLMKLWTREFIQLIQEFPDCTPCLEDLKEALAFCKMNEQFVTEVIDLLKERLLQIGRSTMLILTIYIKTIPVMKLIDPSTMMLEEVSEAFK